MRKKMTYKNAGVDIDKTDAMVKNIKKMCATTNRPEVLGKIGNFSGFFKLSAKKIKSPVLVASTDGVGTKVIVSKLQNKYTTIGIDLVAMCVNDLITCGAEPLFFLDYFASGKVQPKHFYDVLKGIVNGCKQSGCALIGGEIAEMPDCYSSGKYDLAGFSVGVVDEKKIIDGRNVKAGNVLLGITSSGLHSNGYSLARKLFTDKEIASKEWGSLLLKPTKIYVKAIQKLITKVKVNAIAHITGGGLYDNIPRVIPSDFSAVIDSSSWKRSKLFKEISLRSNIDSSEMFRTFNMGIGMVVVINKKDISKAKSALSEVKERAYVIGEVIKGKDPVYIEGKI